MERRRAIIPGLILIIIGIWALLWSLGFEWTRVDMLWPLIVIAGGVSLLLMSLRREHRDSGGVWLGCAAILCGGLFLYITLGPAEWSDLSWLWPAFPVIAGLSWVVAWGVEPRLVANLVMGLIALVAGVIGFLFTYGWLSAESLQHLGNLWPLIPIAVGLGLIIQFVVQRRS
jgi:hypothetical protein